MNAAFERALYGDNATGWKIGKLAKELHLSEDETKRAEAEIQKITDEFIAKADQLAEKKEQEILG